MDEMLMLVRLLVAPIIIFFVFIFIDLIYLGIDRKLSAHMQSRVGPPIRQPFRAIRKLFVKENIVPENAISWLFNLAPILALASTICILLYIPIGKITVLSGYGDLILILYLFMFPILALILGGFASGSPYAIIGAQREMVQLMSCEFALAITIISIVWRISIVHPLPDIFSFSTIVKYPIWEQNIGVIGIIGFVILLLTILVVTPGELSKIPFDAAEAKTEIAGGLLAEYSGRNLAMFYLADAVKTVIMSSIIVNLFFPYNLSSIISFNPYLNIVIDIIFFFLKVFIVIFFAVIFVKVAFARLKISQISNFYFIKLTLFGLFGLALIVFDALITKVWMI